MAEYFLYSQLDEESYCRLQNYVMRAAQHAGVGARLEGDRHEQASTTCARVLFVSMSVSTVEVTYSNIKVTYWRDDDDQSVLDWFKTKFLDRLRSDEWHNAFYWFTRYD